MIEKILFVIDYPFYQEDSQVIAIDEGNKSFLINFMGLNTNYKKLGQHKFWLTEIILSNDNHKQNYEQKCKQFEILDELDEKFNYQLVRDLFKIMIFDIECLVPLSGDYAERENDPIIMISLIFVEHGQQTNYIISSKPFQLENTINIIVESEIDILINFELFVSKFDPDIISGQSIISFDFEQLQQRSNLLLGKLLNLSRNKMLDDQDKQKGRIILDLQIQMKMEQKLKKQSLDFVGNWFLNYGKVEYDFYKMNDDWKSEEGRNKLAYQCLYDSQLCLDLIIYLNIIDLNQSFLKSNNLTFRQYQKNQEIK